MTTRQKRFAEAYAKGYSATEAAIIAGYSSSSAASNAFRLLKNPDIASLIQDLHSEEKGLIMQQYNLCTTSLYRLLEQPDLTNNQRIKAQSQLVQLAKVLTRPLPRLNRTLMLYADAEVNGQTPEPTSQP